jgi:hypothetical protein
MNHVTKSPARLQFEAFAYGVLALLFAAIAFGPPLWALFGPR